MKFDFNKSLEILERTPDVLLTMLDGISSEWISKNEGGNTWSVYDVIGHLILGEKNDWVQRTKIILSDKDIKEKMFEPFIRYEKSRGSSLTELLSEFKALRSKNIEFLRSLNLRENNLKESGIHPDFGEVTMSQLLSTWAVHDLDHIAQIARVMAYQYSGEVGPWTKYLRILQKN